MGLRRIQVAVLVIFAAVMFSPCASWAEEKNGNAGSTPTEVKSDSEEITDNEKGEEDETKQIGEIIVTARTEDTQQEIPVGVTVVDGREMLEKAPRTAAEALRYKPGIWIQKTGHLGGAPVLRGFMGNQVIYLFDSIRRNTAGIYAGPNSYLQNIDGLDIDRIEVIRGPGSVLYGSDAIGGVVNVLTNETVATSDEFEYEGRLYSKYGSVDQEMSLRLESNFSGPNMYGFIGLTSRDIGTLEAGRGAGLQDPSGWDEFDVDAQFNYVFENKHQLEVFLQDFSRTDGYRYDKPNWVQENDRGLYGIRYKGTTEGFLKKFEATAYFHDQEDFTDEKFWDSDKDEETIGMEFQGMSLPSDKITLTYGVHYHRDDIISSDPQSGTEDPSVTWSNPAVFVLSEWRANDKLRLDIGMRWDQFNLQSDAPSFSKLDTAVQDAINNDPNFSLDDLNLDKTDSALTGGAGAVYSLKPNLNLVGHIGTAFRAPNKSDMLNFGQFTYGFSVPSTDIGPETSITYEVGLRAEYPDFAGAVNLYYTQVSNAIISEPGTFGGITYIDIDGSGTEDPGEQVYVKTNADGMIYAQGVELEGKYYLPSLDFDTGDLSVYGNYSWIYGENTEDDEPLDRAFPQNALIGIRWEDNRFEARKWVALETWLVKDFTRIPSDRLTSDPAFWEDPQDNSSGLLGGDGSVPGFTIFNVRGGLKFSDQTTLTLAIENLGDRKYRIKDSRMDAPGLNVAIGLDIVF